MTEEDRALMDRGISIFRNVTIENPPVSDAEYITRSWGDDTLLVERLRVVLANDQQVRWVLQVIDQTCPTCWNNGQGCHCWKDEVIKQLL